MDPNVAWRQLKEAEANHDRGMILAIAFDLGHWLENGGFPPDGMTHAQATLYCDKIVAHTTTAIEQLTS